MSEVHGRRLLSDGIATVLRIGTALTVALIAAGYVVALVGDEESGPQPVAEMLANGGGVASIGIGMLGLAIIPVLVLFVAAAGFQRLGERRSALVSALVAVLLLAALGAAFVLRTAG